VKFLDRGHAGPEDSAGIRFDTSGPHLTLNPGRIAPHHLAFTGDKQHHWVSSRKALVAEFIVGDRPLFVIVCHLKSMRAATRRAEDYAKKQRHAQAEVIQQFATDLLACDPQAAVVILGDFNDIPGSKTLKLLKGAQFHNLLDDQPHRYCYTRRHAGRPQALDHILVSPALHHGATAYIPHVNTDSLMPSFQLASDHDPVLATLPVLTTLI
jgi:predicted extracellular nuclease